MKTVILFFLFISTLDVVSNAQAPKIDSTNYYEHYSMGERLQGKTIHTNWLRYIDVVPIIVEELKKAGYEDVYDNQLYLLPSKQPVILAAYSYNEDFGFVYSDGHTAIPEKKHRQRRSNSSVNSDVDYIQSYYGKKSESGSYMIKKLPSNIFILQEDCYWFQYTDNSADDSKLVTKEIIIEILRQDIRSKIRVAPKPKSE